MAATAALPVLLPSWSVPQQDEGKLGWKPQRNPEIPNPPPPEDPRALEMDMARQLADGKPVKKVRPRRTVDYGGAMGRWTLVCSSLDDLSLLRMLIFLAYDSQMRKMRPNSTYLPHLRPAPPYIIDVGAESWTCTEYTQTQYISCVAPASEGIPRQPLHLTVH